VAKITSTEIGGANVQGMRPHNGTCGLNGCRGKHNPWECPIEFARVYPGRHLPGWTEDGKKIDFFWDGDNIGAKCLDQWNNMQARLKFFTKMPDGARALPFALK